MNNKKALEEWRRVILSEPVEHDEKACEAWGEFQSLPHRARYYDMMAIANKYDTTPQEMKEHKSCWKYHQ